MPDPLPADSGRTANPAVWFVRVRRSENQRPVPAAAGPGYGRASAEAVSSTFLLAASFWSSTPPSSSRKPQIKTTFEKSEPFLALSQESRKKLGWEDKLEKYQKLVGIQGGSKPTDPAVGMILPMIRRDQYRFLGDLKMEIRAPPSTTGRTTFLLCAGTGGEPLPLRLIEGMERMRSLYRAVSQADKNSPPHPPGLPPVQKTSCRKPPTSGRPGTT